MARQRKRRVPTKPGARACAAVKYFWRKPIVETDAAAGGHPSYVTEGRTKGLAGKVRDHPEPSKKSRFAGVEPCFCKSRRQRLVFEIERDKRQIRWLRQASLGQHFEFPLLRGRKVHLENAQRRKRIAPCKGIESGPENHILRYAFGHGGSQLVFYKPAAGGHETAKIARNFVLRSPHVPGRCIAHKAHRNWIVQHRRLVHQLVRGAAHGYSERGFAGSAGQHLLECKRPRISRQPVSATAYHYPMNWIGWALLSAVFAAATALLAKVGVAHVDSNLAMALRTTVVVVFAWGIALALGKHGEIRALDRRTLLFLGLSGMATGFSWICYFRALQLGPASRVAPLDKLSVPLVMVFAWLMLGEKLTIPAVIGGLLITAGAVVMVLG